MNAVLLSVPLIVFALVVLFGFAGCWLRTEGAGSGEETGTTNGNGSNGNGPDGGPEAGPPYVDVVKASGPIAYWRLSDPDQSDSANDEIGPQPGGGHQGTYQGTVDLGIQPGLNDSDPGATPARFDAAGHVDVAQHVDFQTPAFTVEALVHPDKIEARGVVVSNMPSAIVSNLPAEGWALAVVPPPDPTNDGLFEGSVGDGPGSVTVTAKFDLAGLGTSWHLAMTFDGMTLTLYKDGAEVGNAPVQAFVPNTQDPLQIGNRFQGAIQEVAVYDRALPAAEVGDHFAANTPPGP